MLLDFIKDKKFIGVCSVWFATIIKIGQRWTSSVPTNIGISVLYIIPSLFVTGMIYAPIKTVQYIQSMLGLMFRNKLMTLGLFWLNLGIQIYSYPAPNLVIKMSVAALVTIPSLIMTGLFYNLHKTLGALFYISNLISTYNRMIFAPKKSALYDFIRNAASHPEAKQETGAWDKAVKNNLEALNDEQYQPLEQEVEAFYTRSGYGVHFVKYYGPQLCFFGWNHSLLETIPYPHNYQLEVPKNLSDFDNAVDKCYQALIHTVHLCDAERLRRQSGSAAEGGILVARN